MAPQINTSTTSTAETGSQDWPCRLEISEDGSPKGIEIDWNRVTQRHNYLWKTVVWIQPEVAMALLRTVHDGDGGGPLVRRLARILRRLGAPRWAACVRKRLAQRRLLSGLLTPRLRLVPVLLISRTGHELHPDTTFHRQRIGGPEWEQVRDTGGVIELLNIEFAKFLDVIPDADQLWSYLEAGRRQFGVLLELEQAMVITGPVPKGDRPRYLALFGKHNGRPLLVPIIYIDECRASDIPWAVRCTPYGAWAVLLIPDGRTPENAAHLTRVWYSHPHVARSLEGRRYKATMHEEFPELHRMFEVEERKMQNKEPMADGQVWQRIEDTEGFRHVLDFELGMFVDDLQSLPRVQAETERVTEQTRHETHVANLLAVLKGRTIWLLPEQIKRLHDKPCEELPSMQVALDATDAEDFARRAGL